MPTSIPSVKLDDCGICNYCKIYKRNFHNWHEIESLRKIQFEIIVRRIKKLNRPYDCVVPLSGGKDSVYVLYICSKIYNLKCLCVTFDNGFLSDFARKNIKNAIEATNADHIFYGVNKKTLRKLYKLFLQKAGTFCLVCMGGIQIASSLAQRSFNVPTAIAGTGMRYAYRGFIPEIFEAKPTSFKKVIEGDPLEKLIEPIIDFSGPQKNLNKIKKMIRITTKILKIPDPTIPAYLKIFDYVDASYDEIYDTIIKEMNWEKPGDDPEHMDCIVSKLPSYIDTRKFPELTDKTCKHSSLIRLGYMSREEAMKYEEKNMSRVKEPEILDWFLKEIDMDKSEFESSVNDWRKIERYRDPSYDKLERLVQKITGRY
jgi:hypothetical protein